MRRLHHFLLERKAFFRCAYTVYAIWRSTIGHDVTHEERQHLKQLRAVARMRDNGQFAMATLLRETERGLCAPHEAGPGLMVLHGIVPAKFLERMKRGQCKRCTELMTTSDLCSALVAGFELGDVQLRLVLPLLGSEMREALATLPPEESLRLYMVAEEDGRQLNLKVRMGPDSSQALAAMVEDDNEDSASTLGALLELSRDVACWTLGDPDGRQWPPLSPDVVVMTVLPPSLVRATAELEALVHEMVH